MATSTVLNVIQGKYVLIASPANLTSAPLYGGTQLGLTRAFEFEYGERYWIETAEEWGDAPAKKIYLGPGKDARLRAVLRGEDKDMISAAFPSYLAGPGGSPVILPYVNSSSSPRAGTPVSTNAVILCVPSESPSVLPAILLYNGFPGAEEAAKFAASRNMEADCAVSWHAFPDSSGRFYAKGLLEELSL